MSDIAVANGTELAPVADGANAVIERADESDGVGGMTRIADHVVARICGMAAREVPGVHQLADTNLKSAIAGQVQRITGADRSARGVVVQVGQKEVTVDLNLITLYEASIPEIAAEIRSNISERISGITGLRVKEVNIFVSDMHFPADETAKVQ